MSLNTSDGRPCRAIKCLNEAMKASVDRSETDSRCVAFVLLFLSKNGPAKSIPIFANGGIRLTIALGSGPICCFSALAVDCRQVMHFWQISHVSRRAPMIWSLEPIELIKTKGPQ